MRARFITPVIVAACIGLGGAAMAQQQGKSGQDQSQRQGSSDQSRGLQNIPGIPAGADRIIGRTVLGTNGQQVGEISDVLVGTDGKVAGLIVDRGGTLGMGGKNVVVQWNQAEMHGDQITLKLNDQQMSQLPSVD